jgi:hypothetical protein
MRVMSKNLIRIKENGHVIYIYWAISFW